MKAGDKVSMEDVWKHGYAVGQIQKITADGYVVVKWEGIPGHWHYTEEQAKKLEVMDESR